jgi:hypothetical protein
MSVHKRRVKAALKKMEAAVDELWELLDSAHQAGRLRDAMDQRNTDLFHVTLCEYVHICLNLRGQRPERQRVVEFVGGLDVAYRGFKRCTGPEVKALIAGGAPPGLYSFIEEDVIRQVKADERNRKPPEPSEN